MTVMSPRFGTQGKRAAMIRAAYWFLSGFPSLSGGSYWAYQANSVSMTVSTPISRSAANHSSSGLSERIATSRHSASDIVLTRLPRISTRVLSRPTWPRSANSSSGSYRKIT